MELCMSLINGGSISVVNVKPSLPSRSLPVRKNPISLQSYTCLRPPSLSRQFQPSQFAVSASPSSSSSSSTALSSEKDQLPADIVVTETQEPNSRVIFFSCQFSFNSQILVLILFFVWLISLSVIFVQVKLSIQVPPEVCDDCYKRVIDEFMKQAKVSLIIFLLHCFHLAWEELKFNLMEFFLGFSMSTGSGISAWKEGAWEYSCESCWEEKCTEGCSWIYFEEDPSTCHVFGMLGLYCELLFVKTYSCLNSCNCKFMLGFSLLAMASELQCCSIFTIVTT